MSWLHRQRLINRVGAHRRPLCPALRLSGPVVPNGGKVFQIIFHKKNNKWETIQWWFRVKKKTTMIQRRLQSIHQCLGALELCLLTLLIINSLRLPAFHYRPDTSINMFQCHCFGCLWCCVVLGLVLPVVWCLLKASLTHFRATFWGNYWNGRSFTWRLFGNNHQSAFVNSR